jgi:hypothetical protein
MAQRGGAQRREKNGNDGHLYTHPYPEFFLLARNMEMAESSRYSRFSGGARCGKSERRRVFLRRRPFGCDKPVCSDPSS